VPHRSPAATRPRPSTVAAAARVPKRRWSSTSAWARASRSEASTAATTLARACRSACSGSRSFIASVNRARASSQRRIAECSALRSNICQSSLLAMNCRMRFRASSSESTYGASRSGSRHVWSIRRPIAPQSQSSESAGRIVAALAAADPSIAERDLCPERQFVAPDEVGVGGGELPRRAVVVEDQELEHGGEGESDHFGLHQGPTRVRGGGLETDARMLPESVTGERRVRVLGQVPFRDCRATRGASDQNRPRGPESDCVTRSTDPAPSSLLPPHAFGWSHDLGNAEAALRDPLLGILARPTAGTTKLHRPPGQR
jgi:hypothetical protein